MNYNYKKNTKKLILTASIGQCVHIAGSYNFMEIAQQVGFLTEFVGPAISIDDLIKKIKQARPQIVGLSYRLTAQTIIPLLERFFSNYEHLEEKPDKLLFAGTPEVVEEAKRFESFDEFFVGGETRNRIIRILREENEQDFKSSKHPNDLISRIKWKKPFPVIRTHFGQPQLDETIKGIKKIAQSEILDIISIAPDQNTQSNYYHPEEQDERLTGAGGVPLKCEQDFSKLHYARLSGNYPLLRIYAGTRDFIRLAKLYQKTIKNAWAAIPIFWFNQMDGRGPLSLKEGIRQHIDAIKWHAQRKIPVEINDPHHWSLRNAPDAITVADMLLCGIIAKELGVSHFIAQYMFNTPSGSSFEMDLAKMLAKNELLFSLKDESFKIIKQVRSGLASFPLNLNRAKGHLASATLVQLALKPDILHVVTHTESDHAAKPDEIIESCEIIDQVISNAYSSELNFVSKKVTERKQELIAQAKWIVNLVPRFIRKEPKGGNPWLDEEILHKLVQLGIFDAPHLKNNKFACGKIETKMKDGACYSWDPVTSQTLNEIKRIKLIVEKYPQHFQNENEFESNYNFKEMIA